MWHHKDSNELSKKAVFWVLQDINKNVYLNFNPAVGLLDREPEDVLKQFLVEQSLAYFDSCRDHNQIDIQLEPYVVKQLQS